MIKNKVFWITVLDIILFTSGLLLFFNRYIIIILGYGSGPANINNLAQGGHDNGYNNYDSYNSGYSNKAPPSNTYGAV